MHRNTVRRRAKAFFERRFISINENKRLRRQYDIEREFFPPPKRLCLEPKNIEFDQSQTYEINDLDTVSTENNNVNGNCSIEMNNQNIVNLTDSPIVNKREKIASWAIAFNQTRASVNALLRILREEEPLLPKDYRSLCHTPRKINIQNLDSGQYIHLGLKQCLTTFFISNKLPSIDEFAIDINIDGVPLAKSSNICLWPILICVVGYDTVLLVSTYFGRTKPSDIDSYIRPFVEEFLDINENGFEIFGRHFHVKIRSIVADAPARAFFLKIKTHTGHWSCHKCKIKGIYRLHRMTFPGVNHVLRTDEDFKTKRDKNHHNSTEPLFIEKISNLGMVTNVPIDYMHAVLLGTMKYLLRLWKNTYGKLYSLSKAQIKQLSILIISISSQLPNEFNRKVRGLELLKRYKATELRQLLLYVLPVALKGILDTIYYEHFMKFSIAIRILCSSEFCIQQNDIAYLLLRNFVEDFPRLYGQHATSFNVHSLLHLPMDVKTIGDTLDAFSAFKYENHLQVLKKKAKCAHKVLEQISNRNAESNEFIVNKILMERSLEKKNVKRKKSKDILEYVKINNITYSTRKPNNLVFIKNTSEIVEISIIYDGNLNSISFIGRKILNLAPIFENPLHSNKLGMYQSNYELSFGEEKLYQGLGNKMTKVVRFESGCMNYFMKMLH